jgi:Holliday junction resolvase RusA-like endonuclease
MADYEFELPCYIQSGKKKIPISLTWYRNAHFRQSNNIKRKFKELVKGQIESFDPIGGPISIKFVYYAARNNSPDLDNFTSVSKKFFQDAIVELGFIDDDNVKYITKTSEEYGGIDRDNPRVMAYVRRIGQ